MRGLSERVRKLEGPKDKPWMPPPEGGVLYAGPRDPVAIVRALGLEELEEFGLEVMAHGIDPSLPPQLLGGLSETGRYGMPHEWRAVVMEMGRHHGSGQSWSLHWRRGGEGWMFDQSDCMGTWFRCFDCTGQRPGWWPMLPDFVAQHEVGEAS